MDDSKPAETNSGTEALYDFASDESPTRIYEIWIDFDDVNTPCKHKLVLIKSKKGIQRLYHTCREFEYEEGEIERDWDEEGEFVLFEDKPESSSYVIASTGRITPAYVLAFPTDRTKPITLQTSWKNGTTAYSRLNRIVKVVVVRPMSALERYKRMEAALNR